MTAARTSIFGLMGLVCALALSATPVKAERTDRDKPVVMRADSATYDDVRKTRTLQGRVRITQGSLVILADKLEISLDATGYEHAVAIGGENGLAHLQQKREGRNEMVYAEAERIEYDSSTEIAKLVKRAWVHMGKGDEACGNYIEYNGQTESYRVLSNPNGKLEEQLEMISPSKSGQASTCVRKK